MEISRHRMKIEQRKVAGERNNWQDSRYNTVLSLENTESPCK